MASWDAGAETMHPIDFRLVRDGFVTMFWQPSVLDDSLDQLRSRGYRVVEFDGGAWASDAEMYEDLASQLGFPDYFGRTLMH